MQLYRVEQNGEFIMIAPMHTIEHVFMLHREATQRIARETEYGNSKGVKQCAIYTQRATPFNGEFIITRACNNS